MIIYSNLMDCYHFLTACYSCVVKGDIWDHWASGRMMEKPQLKDCSPYAIHMLSPSEQQLVSQKSRTLKVLWGRHCVLQSFLLLWWRLRNSCGCSVSPGVTCLGPWQTSKLTGQNAGRAEIKCVDNFYHLEIEFPLITEGIIRLATCQSWWVWPLCPSSCVCWVSPPLRLKLDYHFWHVVIALKTGWNGSWRDHW